LASSPSEWVSWCGPAALLAIAGQLPKPVSVQWAGFQSETAANVWLATANAQAALAGCYVTGYNSLLDTEHAADHLVLVVSHQTVLVDPNPETRVKRPGDCLRCPPELTGPGRWISVASAPAAPAQTLVFSFADATAYQTWKATNQDMLDNGLAAIRYIP
jgi:hypothetical protein